MEKKDCYVVIFTTAQFITDSYEKALGVAEYTKQLSADIKVTILHVSEIQNL